MNPVENGCLYVLPQSDLEQPKKPYDPRHNGAHSDPGRETTALFLCSSPMNRPMKDVQIPSNHR